MNVHSSFTVIYLKMIFYLFGVHHCTCTFKLLKVLRCWVHLIYIHECINYITKSVVIIVVIVEVIINLRPGYHTRTIILAYVIFHLSSHNNFIYFMTSYLFVVWQIDMIFHTTVAFDIRQPTHNFWLKLFTKRDKPQWTLCGWYHLASYVWRKCFKENECVRLCYDIIFQIWFELANEYMNETLWKLNDQANFEHLLSPLPMLSKLFSHWNIDLKIRWIGFYVVCK